MNSLELRPLGKEWLHDGDYDGHLHQRDDVDMMRMGKQQLFRRNFKIVAISSFSVVTMMGWVFLPINAPVVIAVAGTGGCITIFLANFFGFLSTVLSLAEMSSIAPTAGGQYHWTSEFAPPSMQRFLSYISGWLSSLSWLVGVASGVYLVGTLIPNLIALQSPGFEPRAWQGYLFVVAIMLITFLINGFLAKHLPLLEGFVFCFTILAFVSIVIVLLVLSPKASGSEVFQTFTPDLGPTGLLELFAVQVIIFFSFLGSDSCAHLSEETDHAAIVIPRAMVWSYCINGLLDFIILIVICFCWVDPDAYANTTTGYAFLELFITATGSTTGAIAITSVMVILVVLSATNFVASTSRQVFAFARDNGLPFSWWISRVNQRTLTPINSLFVVTIFTVLISLIGLGSSTAFNAIVSLQIMAIAATYQVSLICLVWRRLFGRRLPEALWSLGKSGLPLNLISIFYGWYLLVYSAMPSEYPVTAMNLNWAPVMFGVVMLLSLIYYFVWARRTYDGPAIHVAHD